MARITARQALDSKKTFYAKVWQQNGYYPIKKFVWNDDMNSFEEFVQKTSGWHSWGFAYPTPTEVCGKVITNYTWWLYIFEHNSYIFSDTPMHDNNTFNGN